MNLLGNSMVQEILTKRCPRCARDKCVVDFAKGKSCCKPCHAARQREYVSRNRARVNEKKRDYASSEQGKAATRAWRDANRPRYQAYCQQYNRDYYRKTLVKRLLDNAKQRASKAGVPFDLQAADIFIPDHCPVLGLPLEIVEGRGGFQPNSPSLDRLIPSLGYVRGNIAVISVRANLLKRDATLSELVRLVSWMRAQGAQ